MPFTITKKTITRTLVASTAITLFASISVMMSCALLQPRQLSENIQNRLKMQDVKDGMLGADFKISMVGDIMLGGTAQEIYAKNGYNYAFEETRNILSRSTLVFGNLEGPLAEWGLTDPSKTYSFKTPPKDAAAALKYAGFNIVSLANNHALDYGVAGMIQTMQALDAEGIKHAGGGMNEVEARTPRIVEVANQKIAFLAYSLTFPESFWATDTHGGVAHGAEENVVADVRAAKKIADIVMISIHWGRESTTELRPYQEQIGRAAIDAGATVVIGHHPHILQAIEHYKEGVILYSLGNFAFGSYSKKVESSIVSQAYFKDKKLIQLRLWPIYVRNTDVLFQSRILDGEDADNVLAHLQQLSFDHNITIENDRGTGVVFF